jgi:hypothetical protein
MSLTWLLDNRCFDENLPELKERITAQGMRYVCGVYKPFGAGIEWDSKPTGEYTKQFGYGSLQFIKALQSPATCGLIDTFCNLPQFACNYYYPRLSKYLFNKDHAFLPYGELIDKEEWVFDTFGVNDCVFMRPNSGFKEFTGQVYEKKYWRGMIELSNTQIQPEDLVVVSSPKSIDAEYRVIVGPNGIVTISGTHIGGKLEPRAEEECCMIPYIEDFVNDLLEEIDYQPDPFWVIDVASAGKYGLKILEVNSMSCSGFYKCDLSKIVGAIKDYFSSPK